MAALEREADATRLEGRLPAVKVLREFEPGDRVAARLEISSGGMLRGAAAGVDVMGDGSVVPFAGGMRRRALEPADGESAYDAVRRVLEPG
jgi:hypothetical protein